MISGCWKRDLEVCLLDTFGELWRFRVREVGLVGGRHVNRVLTRDEFCCVYQYTILRHCSEFGVGSLAGQRVTLTACVEVRTVGHQKDTRLPRHETVK